MIRFNASLIAFALLSAATPTLARASNHELLHALSLLQSGNKAKAANVLEAAYSDSSTSEDERTQIAKTLSFLDAKLLKKHKRFEYAEHVLARSSQSSLNQNERSALARIAGDGYFQAADLDKAEQFYLTLAKSDESIDADYAQYKLGWIDLNRNGQDRAFVRWIERVKDGANREQSLRRSLVRDLGRAWAETDPVNSSQTDLVKDLKLKDSEKSDFVDGVLAGLRRRQNIPAFRTELYQTSFAPAVFKGVLDRGMGLTQLPCSILEWLNHADAIESTKVTTAALLPRLTGCYKYLKESLGNAWQQDERSMQLLVTYERLDLRGLERMPRAGIYKDIGKPELYCQEFIALEKEHFESTKKTLANEFLGEAMSTCSASDYRSNFSEYVMSNPTHFATSPLPLLIAESMTQQERFEHGETMLALFGPKPLDLKDENTEVWVETLRQVVSRHLKDSDFNGAAGILQKHIPVTQVTTARSLELWTLLAATANPADEFQSQLAKKVVSIQLSMLPKKATTEQSVELLTLANRFDMLDAIWSNWKKFDTAALEHSSLITDLFQRTYLMLLDEKGVEIEPALKKSDAGRLILKSAEITKTFSLSNKSASALKDIRLPGPETPKFVKDLRTILAMKDAAKDIDALKLRVDVRLAGKIEKGVATIRKQMKSLETSTWSHPKLLRLARFTIAESCATLSDKIDRIPQPKGITAEQAVQWKAQFDNIVSTIADWKNSILMAEKGGA